MWHGCEAKERVVVKREVPPYVSINPRGEIALNSAAHRLMGGVNYVSLHYDPETNRIGIKELSFDEHIFDLRKYGRRGRMKVVRAKRLLKKFGIRIEQTLRFTKITREPGLMLVLDLSSAVPVLKQHSQISTESRKDLGITCSFQI
jgi:hypothetical protein